MFFVGYFIPQNVRKRGENLSSGWVYWQTGVCQYHLHHLVAGVVSFTVVKYIIHLGILYIATYPCKLVTPNDGLVIKSPQNALII